MQSDQGSMKNIFHTNKPKTRVFAADNEQFQTTGETSHILGAKRGPAAKYLHEIEDNSETKNNQELVRTETDENTVDAMSSMPSQANGNERGDPFSPSSRTAGRSYSQLSDGGGSVVTTMDLDGHNTPQNARPSTTQGIGRSLSPKPHIPQKAPARAWDASPGSSPNGKNAPLSNQISKKESSGPVRSLVANGGAAGLGRGGLGGPASGSGNGEDSTVPPSTASASRRVSQSTASASKRPSDSSSQFPRESAENSVTSGALSALNSATNSPMADAPTANASFSSSMGGGPDEGLPVAGLAGGSRPSSSGWGGEGVAAAGAGGGRPVREAGGRGGRGRGGRGGPGGGGGRGTGAAAVGGAHAARRAGRGARGGEDPKDEEYSVFCGEYVKFSPALVHRYHHNFYLKTKRAKARNQVERFYSTLFFADISGFTRLSARLTAEQLKYHVNTYFTRMIGVVKRYGGDIIKFCGDAVMILWPCDKGASTEIKQANAYLAGLCALAMLTECGEYDVGKGKQAVSLRLHCGMGASNLFGYYVGTEDRWEYLIAGDVMRQIAESESEATHGQTIASPEQWELLKDRFVAERTPKGNWLLLDVKRQLTAVRSFYNGAASQASGAGLGGGGGGGGGDGEDGGGGGGGAGEQRDPSHLPKHLGSEEDATGPAVLELQEREAREVVKGYLGSLLGEQYAGRSGATLVKLSKALRCYVHESARHAIEARADDYIAELRRVTTIFININGIKAQLENGSLKVVQQIMLKGQEHLTKFGGTMRQFIVDDKGCVMIGAFGLPHYSHEDNDSRAIQASQELMAALNELRIDVQIGIAAGSVYCGYVGTTKRCEYAMMGCSVNLAARLMGSAPMNSMQVDQEVYLGSENLFSFEKLKPVNAKGYEQPVQVYRPGQQVLVKRGMSFRQGQTHTGTEKVIGFEREVETLKAAIENLKAGRLTKPVILRGAAGAGKSHVLQSTDLSEILEACKAEVLIGFAKNVHESTPFYVWRRVLFQFFGLEDEEEDGQTDSALHQPEALAARGQKVDRWIRSNTNLTVQELAPLLNDVAPLGLEENEVTRAMDLHERAENLVRLIVELLKVKAGLKPLVFVLENAQWMDPASWQLCHAVLGAGLGGGAEAGAAGAGAPEYLRFLVIVALRPLDEYFEEVPPEFVALERRAQVLELGPLSAADCMELALVTVGTDTLRDHPEMLPPSSADLLAEKTAGNPLFVKNLVLAFRDAFIAGKHKRLDEMPSGVFKDLIIARFDTLGSTEQLVLKTASVLGVAKFGTPLLRAMLSKKDTGGDTENEVQEALATLSKGNGFLTKEGDVETPADEWLYHFAQASVQETVYNLMLVDQRQELHQLCAAWYEQGGGAAARNVISFHWLRSHNVVKKVQYLQQDAEESECAFRNEDTVQFYNQLLNLALSTEQQSAVLSCVKVKEAEGGPNAAALPQTPINTDTRPTETSVGTAGRPGRGGHLRLTLRAVRDALLRRKARPAAGAAAAAAGGGAERRSAPRQRRGSTNVFERSQSMLDPAARKMGHTYMDGAGLRANLEFSAQEFSAPQLGYWVGRMALAFYQKGRLPAAHNHAQVALLYLGFRPLPQAPRAQKSLVTRNKLAMLRALGGGARRPAGREGALALQLYHQLLLVQFYRGQVRAVAACGALLDSLVDTLDLRPSSVKPAFVARLNSCYALQFVAQGQLQKAAAKVRDGDGALTACKAIWRKAAKQAARAARGARGSVALVPVAAVTAAAATGGGGGGTDTGGAVDLEGQDNGAAAAALMLARALIATGNGEWDDAIKDYCEVLDIHSKMGDLHRYSEVLCLKSYVLLLQGKIQEATNHFTDLKENSKRQQDRFLMLTSFQAVAFMQVLKGDTEKAHKTMVEVHGIPGVHKHNLVSLALKAQLAARRGRGREALAHLERAAVKWERRPDQPLFTAALALYLAADAALALLEALRSGPAAPAAAAAGAAGAGARGAAGGEDAGRAPRVAAALGAIAGALERLGRGKLGRGQPGLAPLAEVVRARRQALDGHARAAAAALERARERARERGGGLAAALADAHLARLNPAAPGTDGGQQPAVDHLGISILVYVPFEEEPSPDINSSRRTPNTKHKTVQISDSLEIVGEEEKKSKS